MKAVNPITVDATTLSSFESAHVCDGAITVEGGFGEFIANVLTRAEVETLLADINGRTWQAVGLDGIAAHYSEGDVVGSWRATIDSQPLADLLWQRLGLNTNAFDFTAVNTIDAVGHWRALGLNSRLRCIRYESGGLLVPHYDAPFDYGDGRRTLRSLVLYLGQRGQSVRGGATRFLKDPQAKSPYAERDFADWTRLAHKNEVLAQVKGEAGDVLVFDHRILHDSQVLEGEGSKTIIRTDVVFERVEML